MVREVSSGGFEVKPNEHAFAVRKKANNGHTPGRNPQVRAQKRNNTRLLLLAILAALIVYFLFFPDAASNKIITPDPLVSPFWHRIIEILMPRT